MSRLHWLILLPLALAACAGTRMTVPADASKAAYAERAERLGRLQTWALDARISLDDGKEGGSGSLRWGVDPGGSEMDFHGAMGRGAWRLEINPDFVVLREANGEQYVAADVDTLIRQRFGWPVPVAALRWWVRGLAAPGGAHSLQLDNEGRPVKLAQDGWQVKYSRYGSSGGESLPLRLEAKSGHYRVKLSVRRWRIGGDDGPRG